MRILALCFALFSSSLFAQQQKPTLIGGRPADLKDWPASVYPNSSCSATIVGETVVLIAAHCVNGGGTIRFKAAGKAYAATCVHSKDYRTDNTADYALCITGEKVVGVPFESINQDASIIKVGTEVLLTGYGCVRIGGGGGNDGIYRIGETKILRVPTNNNDIVTRGGAALCYGDSGGPAFMYLDKEKTKRVVISVNSRGDISTTSYLSALHTPKSKRFFTAFLAKYDVEICGITDGAVGCR